MCINKKQKTAKGKPSYSIEIFCIFITITLIIVILTKVSAESLYNKRQEDLIDDYYKNQEHTLHYATNADAEDTISTNVDCILRVPRLEIELPVCKGNFNYNIAKYNLAVFDNNSILGETTYTIMGHHSVAFNVACGWLPKAQVGDYIAIEQYGIIYDYQIVNIEVGYAHEMTYLFSIDDLDIVYLASCDYSLGKKDRTVYRMVKCIRI